MIHFFACKGFLNERGERIRIGKPHDHASIDGVPECECECGKLFSHASHRCGEFVCSGVLVDGTRIVHDNTSPAWHGPITGTSECQCKCGRPFTEHEEIDAPLPLRCPHGYLTCCGVVPKEAAYSWVEYAIKQRERADRAEAADTARKNSMIEVSNIMQAANPRTGNTPASFARSIIEERDEAIARLAKIKEVLR